MTDPDEPQSRLGVDPGPIAPFPEADAQDEVAKAEARAEAARARLKRLREAAETAATDDAATHGVERRRTKLTRVRLRLPRPRRPRWLRRPGRKTIAAGVGVVLACASLGASGYMVWEHRTAVHKRQLAAEFTAAARQGVTALLSVDANHAKEDFQRIIDASTGDFKNQISVMSGLMAMRVAESKISSTATVEAVAVESMSDNSAVVLVAAKSNVTNADNTKQPPLMSRISVGITRDGDQLKMSKVDFLQ